jgi:CheY-like chemotaxis protein
VLPTFGDEGRLQQVVTNLLQNALRFTPAGKRVWVNAGRRDGVAEIAVVDEGRGIEPESLGSIFEMFAQSRQGLARTEGGLGLGLTIAERIVASHGGRIEAASPGLGLGATFTVTLPLDARATRRSDDAEGLTAKLRIVVVEDQADAREALGMILQLDGHSIASAAEGPEGLELILSERPDVALLDLGLPGMTGFEIATRVREELGESITLIAMSGYGQPEDVRRAEASGFNRHLTKPVDPKRLAAALRDISWRENFVSAARAASPARYSPNPSQGA